jgi:hypothetical protein
MTPIHVEHNEHYCVAWCKGLPDGYRVGWLVPYAEHAGDREKAEADARALIKARNDRGREEE